MIDLSSWIAANAVETAPIVASIAAEPWVEAAPSRDVASPTGAQL